MFSQDRLSASYEELWTLRFLWVRIPHPLHCDCFICDQESPQCGRGLGDFKNCQLLTAICQLLFAFFQPRKMVFQPLVNTIDFPMQMRHFQFGLQVYRKIQV
jgi:hypothetical protein